MELKETRIWRFMAVPDLVSLLNLSFGFLSILMAINGQITISALFIIIALIFDSIDGWVARKLSRIDKHGFGKNIDSLCDVVSFGLAPGILLYSVGNDFFGNSVISNFVLEQFPQFSNLLQFSQFPEFYYFLAVVALFIAICGVLRLTRFNVIADKLDFNGFIGLPIPTTGIILSSFILSGFFDIFVAIILMVIIGFLMISNIKYSKLNNPKLLIVFAILVILILIPYPIVFFNINIPATAVFILTLIYIFNGLFNGLLSFKN